MIPNTLIIGAMKSATTGLCDILSRHPEAFVSCPKEPDFFSCDEVYAKGIDWYSSLFSSAENCRVIAEGSTSYTKQLQFPHASTRIAQHLPQARLIYMARHPLARIQSHWAHETLKGRTNLDLSDFVHTHPEAIDTSCYWKQISRYLDHFPPEQICVVFFEDYCRSSQDVFDRCCDFLDLSRRPISETDIDRNETSRRRRDVAPVRMLRQFRWFDVQFERAKQRIPKSMHDPLKRLLKSNAGAAPAQWSPDLVSWVEDRLAADNEQFLTAYGKPCDFWISDCQSFTCSVPSSSR